MLIVLFVVRELDFFLDGWGVVVIGSYFSDILLPVIALDIHFHLKLHIRDIRIFCISSLINHVVIKSITSYKVSIFKSGSKNIYLEY